LTVRQVNELQESLDRLRSEVGELRASRRRLALAADADRRRIERELHDGPQQQLVALAVKVQLARQLVDPDPSAARALLEEMGREVREALAESRELANRIYPPLLEAGGLGVALRSAAATVDVAVDLQVPTGAACPPEVAGTVYFCCVEALERIGAGARATVTVSKGDGTLTFEIVGSGAAADEADPAGMRDRVEALGGRLAIASEPGSGTRISGSLPLSL
jgi:signal transduction histidine kinase